MNEYPIDNSMISFIIDTAFVNQDLIVPYNKEKNMERQICVIILLLMITL